MIDELLIEIFLFYPTKELLSLINDEDVAIRLLRELPDSAIKGYRLLQVEDRVIPTRIGKIVKKNDYYIFTILKDYNELITDIDWNHLAFCAAYSGHGEILKYAISNGANDWNTIACCAETNNHRAILNNIFDREGKKVHFSSIGTLLLYSARKSRKDLYDLVIIKFKSLASIRWELDHSAAEGCNMKIINDVIRRGGRLNYIAYSAACYGHTELVYEMITRAEQNRQRMSAKDYEMIAINSVICHNLTMIIAMLLRAEENNTKVCVNNIILFAAERGCSDIVLYLYDRATKDLDLLYSLIKGRLTTIAHSVIDTLDLTVSFEDYDAIVKEAIANDLDSIVYRLINYVYYWESMEDYAIKKNRLAIANKIRCDCDDSNLGNLFNA